MAKYLLKFHCIQIQLMKESWRKISNGIIGMSCGVAVCVLDKCGEVIGNYFSCFLLLPSFSIAYVSNSYAESIGSNGNYSGQVNKFNKQDLCSKLHIEVAE